MASKGGAKSAAIGVEGLDVDIKTEAVEFDEDFDTEWNDDYQCVSPTSLTPNGNTQTNITNGHFEVTNGYDDVSNFEESSSPPSNNSEILRASRIKMETSESLEEEFENQRGRFNLRKRKGSLNSSHESFSLSRDNETDVTLEDQPMKKMRKKVQYSYTSNMLQEALDLVHSQNISIMNAAKQYGIPRSTLRRYALTMWAAAAPKSRNKQEPALTPPEEAHLVSMITKMSKAGKYVSTMDVKSTVQYLLDESQRVVFKDRNRPNAGWVQRFRKRHRDLQIKGSGYTAKRQTPLTKQDICEWYNELSQYLRNDWEINPEELFCTKNENRIFNLDEMSLALNCKQDLIEENVLAVPKNEEDFNEVTILTAVSAAGEFMQPLIIQKGEGGGHEDDIMPLDQNSYGISFSLSGKMNSDIFVRWLEAFDRELSEKGIQKPIVIFLDDIFAHFHISVFSYAIDNDIILLCLQSQVGSTFQPAEAEISENVRREYRAFCKEHYRSSGIPVSMDQFPETFLRAWEAVRDGARIKEDIQESFSFYGLLPLNPDAPGYAQLPLASEILPKEAIKTEKVKVCKEPKAKKTMTSKAASKLSSQSAAAALVPTVKIKKLDKQSTSNHYKIVDGFAGAASNTSKFPEPVDQKIPFSDPLPKTNPETFPAQEHKRGTPSKVKNPPSTRPSMVGNVSQFSQDRLIGRQDGIRKCLDLMESFIPTDVIPVWRNRGDDLKNSSEIPYCMWKTVNNLLLDMTSQTERKGKVKKAPKTLKSKCGVGKALVNRKPSSEDSLHKMEYMHCDPLVM